MAETEQKVPENQPTLLEDYYVVQELPTAEIVSRAGTVETIQEKELGEEEPIYAAIESTGGEHTTDSTQEIATEEPDPVSADATPEVEIDKPDPVAADVTSEIAIKQPEPVPADATPELATVEPDHIAGDESNEVSEPQETGDPTLVVKVETAPADFRFPTTNQTRHCFTRYIEYHRCTATKGEDAAECAKFAKYYRSLCPGEWTL